MSPDWSDDNDVIPSTASPLYTDWSSAEAKESKGSALDMRRQKNPERELAQTALPDIRDNEHLTEFSDRPIAEISEVPGRHSNSVFKVRLTNGRVGYFKPEESEASYLRPGSIPDGTEWRRELAAYELDKHAILGLVPETVVRHEPQLGSRNASLQAEAPFEPMPCESYRRSDREAMAVLDYVLANTDRHPENWATAADGRPAAIDNGLCMPEDTGHPICSNWVADYLEQPLSESLVERLKAIDQQTLLDAWQSMGIGQAATEAALDRLNEIIKNGAITGASWKGAIVAFDDWHVHIVRDRI